MGGFTTTRITALLSAIEQDFAAWAAGFDPMANPDRPEFTDEFT